jgi:hypothetical protein
LSGKCGKTRDIEAKDPPYGIAVLSRFRSKVGPERLSKVVDHAVEVLVKKGKIKGESLALDSTFIKAYSRKTLTTAQVTAIPNQGLEEQSKPKTWAIGFIWPLTSRASCPLP